MRKIFYFFKYLLNVPFNLLKGNKFSALSKCAAWCVIRSSSLGKYSYIGHRCSINNTTIGNFTSIAPNCMIGGMEHLDEGVTTSLVLKENPPKSKRTFIGHDTWIGASTVVREGVKIGNGVVVGAGSVVINDLPDFSIAVGAPAKIKKYRFTLEMRQHISTSKYWLNTLESARVELKGMSSSEK